MLFSDPQIESVNTNKNRMPSSLNEYLTAHSHPCPLSRCEYRLALVWFLSPCRQMLHTIVSEAEEAKHDIGCCLTATGWQTNPVVVFC